MAGDPAAIGYVSMGSLNDDRQGRLPIDGVAATVENGVKDGSYTAGPSLRRRPPTARSAEHRRRTCINYIMSAEGQAIINEEKGYIGVDDGAKHYESLACLRRDSPWAAPPP